MGEIVGEECKEGKREECDKEGKMIMKFSFVSHSKPRKPK